MAQDGAEFLIRKSDCLYASCYCEENIWQLCHSVQSNASIFNQLWVIFISNRRNQIPIWCQKSSRRPDQDPVVWDYHVICIRSSPNSEAVVYDLDTILPFPCTLR
eukprot:TRINITY_DN8567_c0_g1::TRINITY_DN8567_c0_g1_i1::g.8533::m.8533 TRINITY_DN8567_c0_g1::TRINITY_DN8567_c0_g1_i1::g.8533  ORF type:complete len:105 (-),score=-5.33,sp/Q1LWX3/NTAQ1_DANRE/52.22/4e-28,Nt_Gln_amidase/PF09764.4/3.2e-32 TRINITY_DN8567_c0_g1_i1:3-317(-)